MFHLFIKFLKTVPISSTRLAKIYTIYLLSMLGFWNFICFNLFN